MNDSVCKINHRNNRTQACSVRVQVQFELESRVRLQLTVASVLQVITISFFVL